MTQKVRMKDFYTKIVPQLKQKVSVENDLAVPKVTKVVINMGLGKHSRDDKVFDSAKKDLADITCQMPTISLAKKSISEFGVRAGMKSGLSVTLRGEMMYNFLYRLINIALPRIRDFRGFKDKSFDEKGNFNIGIKDQSIFPEVNMDSPTSRFGFNITIVTNAKDKESGKHLLELLGFPFVSN